MSQLYRLFRQQLVVRPIYAGSEEIQHRPRGRFAFVCRLRPHDWGNWLRVNTSPAYLARVCARCNLEQREHLYLVALHDSAAAFESAFDGGMEGA